MLWKSRGSHPKPRYGGGRRHSVIEESKRESESSARQNGRPADSEGNLAPREARSTGSLPFEEDHQSVDSSSASREWLEPQESNKSLEHGGTPEQSNKNSRFSLMRFRHASDPQLSATFAAGQASPLPNLPSEYFMLCPSLGLRGHNMLTVLSTHNNNDISYLPKL